ncbi:MAG TPA: carboxypeptidase regulatory-like domain-containing protein, partial [Pyrinomonadaceae bacterium]|nr:carboxypeptidase regulatory-like domain-containing protein [Pyrinomonadaceae bacterium]
YYPAGNTAFNWKTKVGRFTVASCTAPAQGTLTGTVTDCGTGQPLALAIVDVTGGPSTGFSSATLANGSYTMKLAPGSYQVTFGGRSCATAGPFNVTITDGGTTVLDQCLQGAPDVGFVSAVVSGGNGNGVIDRNECNTLNVTISNPGCAPLTGATGVLSSSTPGVIITQPNSPYPNIPVDGTGTNTVPFQINTTADFVCGTNISFTLTVTSNEGTFTVNFMLPSCTISGSGSIDNSDPTQTGRLTRNGVASTCATPKAFPGMNDSLVRHFDQYSFTNNSASTACVTFSVSNTCASNLFAATYAGSYNPANIMTNYQSDPGASGNPMTWSTNVAAGQTIVLVIHEVTPNAGCAGYTFSLSGLPTDGGGACPVPIAAAAGATIATESCPPSNNAIDPGERVTVNLKVMNIGGAPTTNLVGTLLPTGGVTAPSDPQSYGSIPAGGMAGRDFSFTAAGNCGDTITATLQLQDGATSLGTVSYTFKLGVLGAPTAVFAENFDSAVPPALPAGFTTTTSGAGIAWTTSAVSPDTAPNDAFGPETATTGVTNLTSPVIAVPAGETAQLQFRNLYNLESGFDAETLLISIGGGPFQDILAAGGSFASGGYNSGIGWTGLSGGTAAAPAYITTTVNLPASALGQNIQLRWSVSSDSSVIATGAPGVRIDTINVTSTARVCTANCGTVRLVVTSTLTRVDATTVRANYTVQNIGTSTAANVMLTTGRLGSTNGTPLPQALGSIPPAGSASSQINFTNSTPGASSTLVLGGTFTGGTFSTTRRVTIP